jgi:hypothetical protein
MTLAFGSTGYISCFGSMTFPVSNFAITNSGSFTTAILFSATTTGKTFTTNGVTVGNTMTVAFNGVGGEWTLGSALTMTSGAVEVRAGSFKTGNYNITANQLQSTSAYAAFTRVIDLGSSTLTLSGSAGAISLFVSTTLTLNAGTSQITCIAASPTFITNPGLTFYNVTFSSTALVMQICNYGSCT